MLEFFAAHGETIVAISVGLLALGGLFQRDRTKEKRLVKLENHSEKCMTESRCMQRQEGCQRFYEAELAHGKNEFEEIKKMFYKMKDCNDVQHKMILDHLLDNKS